MSVMDKIEGLGKMKKRDLLALQYEIEVKQMDLETEKEELLSELIKQREAVLKTVEDEDEREKVERIRLDNLEKTYANKVDAFKDNLETLKAIATIFKIREERKASAKSRFYGFCGILISFTGIGLAYGSDTLGTLLNKKTLEAAKSAIVRFIPRV